MITRIGSSIVPTTWGAFQCVAYAGTTGTEHVAFVHGDVRGGPPPLVRVHSECLTGDVFGSARCDCGPQLDLAMQRIADDERGVLVYLRGHEGRGIGIGQKIRAYALQDDGLDTVDANLALGLPIDSRSYQDAAQILTDLGVHTVQLMTNNPHKSESLSDHGITVLQQVPIHIEPTVHNASYLLTKQQRMRHLA
jgi:3,4-dihydroxy 2-butanone 4-phosphate synthase / GTP cyclohydrolase II